MESNELLQKIDSLKDKLHRAQRRNEGLKEKSKLLEMQYDDARGREQNSSQLVMELIERQRELNVMLNRANIMLNRTQEAMALTALEFNEMAKALPEPKKEEWSDRITRINDLFKQTGVQDAEMGELDAPESSKISDSFADDDVFSRKQSVWARAGVHEPVKIEAEAVSDEDIKAARSADDEQDIVINDPQQDSEALEDDFESLPRRKTWWRKIAG